MKIFEANISENVFDFLDKSIKRISDLETANEKIFKACGIQSFFEVQEELEAIKKILSKADETFAESDRSEYGDFQTNMDLTLYISKYLNQFDINPKIVIEPTFGKGNFIISSLITFKQIERIFGIEIYKPYVWETKFKILQFFLDNPIIKKPKIRIFHLNIFNFDLKRIAKENLKKEFLIIGNPPWVTNSKLTSLNSENLPQKSNFKNHNGFDAITGKSNFDIGEYITLKLIDAFQNSNGQLAFLLKNSVIKNIVFDQRQCKYKISNLQKFSIDSKKEFNVSVESSLFFCKLNQTPEFICREYDLYKPDKLLNSFGWVNDKFVSNISNYNSSSYIDGVCQFEWRQGIKHDLSSLMELERVNSHFVNGLQQEIDIEEDLIYGILKSSDLKQIVIDKTRKFTIVTQTKVGQDTSFIKKEYPKTYDYLYKNKYRFNLRKSSIYKGKPDFSIFGIGDYSFKPFKIAISGLYKKYCFNLILPQEMKPVMLDDTCYFIGFDNIEYAAYTLILLNSSMVKKFLQAITFSDAKRTFTKDVLMRIDLLPLTLQFSKPKIKYELDTLNTQYNLNINLKSWNEYVALIISKSSLARGKQLTFLENNEKFKVENNKAI